MFILIVLVNIIYRNKKINKKINIKIVINHKNNSKLINYTNFNLK